ncbi:hypothetical protein KP003_19140 [Geomonas nitrogeniifigens]|uniref:hypothetical protein n=1 Tax=Geomonas diazotrophica TaxID=2843197 RepID=UPI001C2BF7D6|nr:hypothetical protein [Geomonas nitrogeniifigens]QXE86449.1 hypothetical protein KP003_19140 [Geomonas nitrogeniifigens]
MTTKIILFTPKGELSAGANLTAFIEVCRYELKVFGANLVWDAPDWDISSSVERASRKRRGRIALVWSNYDTSKQRIGEIMSQPFLDFGRAYMRYQHAMRPTDNVGQRLSALRALERALIEESIDGVPHVELSNGASFQRAAYLLQQKFSSGTAYKAGTQLEIIANFIRDQLFLAVPFIWRNPIPREQDRNRVGKKFNEERTKKLPTETALQSLATAFNQARHPIDVLTTSVGAILASAPSRISEVLGLPFLCEHTEKLNGDVAYGIRLFPAKGADGQIKWIGGTMADVTRSAIEKIRNITNESRRIAKWYETHPGQLYLADEIQHLRYKKFLSPEEIASIIGFKKDNTSKVWAHSNGCKRVQGPNDSSRILYLFTDIETAVVRLLPKGFPVMNKETGLRFKDALFILPKNFFHAKKASYRCMFEIVTEDSLNIQLGGGVHLGKSSVFSRLGFTEADGSAIKMNTHQLRHWLNTLASGACLSQLDIALWSGRKDIRQNQVYDHITSDEFLARIRDLKSLAIPESTKEIAMNAPMSREEYLQQKFPTAHSTPFGFCVHDWSSLPCQRHADCLKCREHICLKCDAGKASRIRRTLDDCEVQLSNAEEAVADEYYGADRWLEHHRERTEILRSLVALLDDPEVPNSAIFQISLPNEYSLIRAAIDDRRLVDAEVKQIEMTRLLRENIYPDEVPGVKA